ncbi:MAG TPA: VanW family protein, partial [Syntrophomonadaceae bacterium]|nr:VanW family protein [Syntrophomonadaceae bacterium]
ISVALLLYFYQFFYKSDRYLPGVHIAAFSVEGYTGEEAMGELNSRLASFSDTPLEFVYDDYSYLTTLGEIYFKPDMGQIIKDIWEQEKSRGIYSKAFNMDGSKLINYPIKVEYNREAIDNIVNTWNSNIAVDYLNASLEIDNDIGLVIVPSKPGIVVDFEATLAGLPQEILLDKGTKTLEIPIVMKEVNPRITENDLSNMGELASYTTWYREYEVDRSHNVKISSQSIDGTMVEAGEVFSFNDVVGKRTYETGYRDAAIIVGGLFEPGLGGGICQVSSTLYNAALLAGMEIVERHNHGLAVAYIPLGRDATITYGLQDLKFRNHTDSPIYLRTSANQGKLTIYVYGNTDYRQNIEISHVVDKVYDFTEIRKVDDTLAVGVEEIETNGMPGYMVRSFRTFYDQNGNITKTENLATDRYSPLNKVVLIGPTDEEDVIEKPIENSGLENIDSGDEFIELGQDS